jgi:hypothetical protein
LADAVLCLGLICVFRDNTESFRFLYKVACIIAFRWRQLISISSAQKLVRKLESGREIRQFELQRALPQSIRPRFEEIVSNIGALDLVYAVSVVLFYGGAEDAFYLALSAPNRAKDEEEGFTYRKFYDRQREAYERRRFYRVPHHLSFLEAAVDFMPEREDGACSGWTSGGTGEPSPWRENAVRALEDAPRAIEDMTHLWDREQ